MLNFGRPLVGLTAEEWGTAIEALRFAAHTDPDPAYLGLEQERAHLVAEKMARQLEYGVPCMACEVELEMNEEAKAQDETPAAGDHAALARSEGHSEPEETCEACK